MTYKVTGTTQSSQTSWKCRISLCCKVKLFTTNLISLKFKSILTFSTAHKSNFHEDEDAQKGKIDLRVNFKDDLEKLKVKNVIFSSPAVENARWKTNIKIIIALSWMLKFIRQKNKNHSKEKLKISNENKFLFGEEKELETKLQCSRRESWRSFLILP